jgi:hypothetical protein
MGFNSGLKGLMGDQSSEMFRHRFDSELPMFRTNLRNRIIYHKDEGSGFLETFGTGVASQKDTIFVSS